MAISTVAEMVTSLSDIRLLDPPQQTELTKLQQKHADPKALARELLARGWLTTYQASLVIHGKAKELVLGSYVIMERLGEGGMGEVFKARHQKLGRVVALKVMRKKKLSNPDSVRRFHREIKAASQLTHPNIVMALDAGQVGEAIFFIMEYVEGTDFSKLLKQSGTLAVPQACDYIRQAAAGLQHAVERGLVHRDIKPSNLLVTRKSQGAAGRPWGLVKILDMGLARATEAAASDMDATGTLTHAGVVVGTPDYISPEQARDSRTADIRSDIYSLGCTFYHLLAGQVPFPGGTGMEKLFKQQIEVHQPLREIRPDVPPEVEAVVDRMLAKKQEDRYQTPAEVAQALEPFCQGPAASRAQESTALAHDPSAPTPEVPARKRSKLPKGQQQPVIRTPAKPGARPPRSRFALAIAGGFGGALLVAGVIIAVSGGRDGAGTQVVENTKTGVTTQPRVNDTRTKTVDTRPKTVPVIPGQSPLDQLDRFKIPAEQTADLPREAVAVIGDHRLRHWGSVNSAAFSPDGRLLATGGGDRVIRLWDVATGRPAGVFKGHSTLVSGVAFVADGKLVVSIGWDQSVKLHDIFTGQELPYGAQPKEGSPLALSPDGRFLVLSGPRQFKLWDMFNKREIAVLEGYVSGSFAAFSMDGGSLLMWNRQTFGQAHDLKILDAATGKVRHTFAAGKETVFAGAVAPDGQTLAYVGGDQIRVVNAKNGQPVATFPAGTAGAGGTINQLAFGPDGKTLAAASPGKLRLINLENRQDTSWATRQNMTTRLVFSPDGKALVSTSYDSAVRLWDVPSGQERVQASGHRGVPTFIAFTPDGRSLVSGGSFGDPGTRVWDMPSLQQRGHFSDQGYPAAILTPDGQIVGRSATGFVAGDVASGKEQTFPLGNEPQGATTVFSANGKVALTRNYKDQSAKVWDVPSFQQRPISIALADFGYVLALSPDGQTLAALEKGTIHLYDTATGKARPVRFGVGGRFSTLTFSPDGRWLAGASGDGTVKVYDVSTGQETASHQEIVSMGFVLAQFSPDSQFLATWSNQRLTVLDPATGKVKLVVGEQKDSIRAVAFARHPRLLAVCDQEGRLSLFDLTTAALSHTIQLPGPAAGLAFAADGRHLATGNTNGTIFILRLAKGSLAPLGLPGFAEPVRPNDEEAKPIKGPREPFKPGDLDKPFRPGVRERPIEPKPSKPAIPEPDAKPVVPEPEK